MAGNIAFIKVYNGILTLAEIQALHATYKQDSGINIYKPKLL
jgi:hypothetical protein